jgi:hypothetical protein
VAHRIILDFIGFAVVEVCVGVGGWFIATKDKKISKKLHLCFVSIRR